ncbi:hypothetical protein SLS53_003637 [Cytospora paraplurivora]|uniref:FAD-binding domain-containing protein n=1 Tax=Cytospora paraplurivora TaxID=2898453 RepID=A0AAN9UA54_9PEZI
MAPAYIVTRGGHTAIVLERAQSFPPTGGSIHISPNACRALSSLELMSALEDHVVVEQHITLMSYATGAVLKRMDLVPSMQDDYGFPYLSLGRVSLHDCLLRAAQEAGAIIKYGCVVRSVDFNAPAVHVADGRVITADLIVGADGENSRCRSLLLGRPDPPLHFGHKVFSCPVSLAALRSQSDSARFAEDPGMLWWMGPGTMVLGSTQGKHQGMDLMGGLIEPQDTPLQARPLPVSKKEIKEAFQGWDPVIEKLLDKAGDCVKWTSTATAVLEQWAHPAGRFVLLGDAAHAMTPYLAQGASSALEDAVALGVLLSQVTELGQVPEAVRIFQNLREPRCRRLKEVSQSLRDVYCMNNGPRQESRDHELMNVIPGPGFVIPWLDPDFQAWVYGYDVVEEARRAWPEREQGT